MKTGRTFVVRMLIGSVCALVAGHVMATGVPVGGFLPLVGIGLSNEYDTENLDFYTAYNTSAPTSGMMLGHNGTPYFDLALLDTGAGFSLLTAQAYDDFNINGPYSGNSDGFAGTESIQFGGATGTLSADVNEPLGLYAAGLQSRDSATPLTMNLGTMKGQTNTSMITIPAESDLPNVVGLTYASRYATYIRSDMPQIFELDGKTVRTPYIDFLPLGSGGQGIARRAPMQLNPGGSFAGPPLYVFNLENLDIDEPWKDPSYPTLLQASTGGAFLNVNAKDNLDPQGNNGDDLGNQQFLFDTGADVTVVSSLSAIFLGYEGVPEFTVAVVGSGGTAFDVPGFFVDELTIFATQTGGNGNVILHDVPVIVLDVTNPADPGNTVPGIVGTNLIAGRNVVFDPKPAGSGVGPSLYIGDPVTTEKNWTTTAASGTFGTGTNWSGGTTPTNLGIANVRHVSGGDQMAVVTANTTVWEVNVSGSASQTMTLQVQNGVTLQTFSGINIEQGGAIQLQNGTLDTQFIEMLGGTLSGTGAIETGSGPIPGQVENRLGTVAPGNGVGVMSITGRFANGTNGTLAFELGGISPGTQYDQLVVDGGIALDGTLSVTLANLGGGTFAPSIGNSFTLITSTEGIGGEFDQLALPAGYLWNINYGSNSVVLTMFAIGLAGDYNQNGVVDAADYVVWRNTMGAAGNGLAADGNGDKVVNQADFDVWKSQFGKTNGSGSTLAANVPEPATAGLLLLCVGLLGMSRPSNRERSRALLATPHC